MWNSLYPSDHPYSRRAPPSLTSSPNSRSGSLALTSLSSAPTSPATLADGSRTFAHALNAISTQAGLNQGGGEGLESPTLSRRLSLARPSPALASPVDNPVRSSPSTPSMSADPPASPLRVETHSPVESPQAKPPSSPSSSSKSSSPARAKKPYSRWAPEGYVPPPATSPYRFLKDLPSTTASPTSSPPLNKTATPSARSAAEAIADEQPIVATIEAQAATAIAKTSVVGEELDRQVESDLVLNERAQTTRRAIVGLGIDLLSAESDEAFPSSAPITAEMTSISGRERRDPGVGGPGATSSTKPVLDDDLIDFEDVRVDTRVSSRDAPGDGAVTAASFSTEKTAAAAVATGPETLLVPRPVRADANEGEHGTTASKEGEVDATRGHDRGRASDASRDETARAKESQGEQVKEGLVALEDRLGRIETKSNEDKLELERKLEHERAKNKALRAENDTMRNRLARIGFALNGGPRNDSRTLVASPPPWFLKQGESKPAHGGHESSRNGGRSKSTGHEARGPLELEVGGGGGGRGGKTRVVEHVTRFFQARQDLINLATSPIVKECEKVFERGFLPTLCDKRSLGGGDKQVPPHFQPRKTPPLGSMRNPSLPPKPQPGGGGGGPHAGGVWKSPNTSTLEIESLQYMNEKLRRDLKEAQETVEALMTELEEANDNAEESKSVAEQAVTENKEDWSALGEAYKDASW